MRCFVTETDTGTLTLLCSALAIQPYKATFVYSVKIFKRIKWNDCNTQTLDNEGVFIFVYNLSRWLYRNVMDYRYTAIVVFSVSHTAIQGYSCVQR